MTIVRLKTHFHHARLSPIRICQNTNLSRNSIVIELEFFNEKINWRDIWRNIFFQNKTVPFPLIYQHAPYVATILKNFWQLKGYFRPKYLDVKGSIMLPE